MIAGSQLLPVSVIIPSSIAPLLNSLTAIDAHEHQFFDKLLWGLLTVMTVN